MTWELVYRWLASNLGKKLLAWRSSLNSRPLLSS
jgi:hypothetical protein